MMHDKHPDIVAITEIYPKNTSFENVREVYNIEGYDSFIHDLKSGRGVIIYTIKNLNASELLINEKYNESVWLDVDLKGNDRLVIGCIYRSPNDQRENIQQLEKCINEVVMKNRSHLLIMGDFNLKEIDWKNENTSVNELHPATIFLEATRDLFLHQHVNKPTRFRGTDIPTILDLVFTNEPNMVENIEYLPGLGLSDHLVLSFKFNCYIQNTKSEIEHRNYNKGNYDQIKQEVAMVDWASELANKNVENAWECLAEKLTLSIEKNIPVNKTTQSKQKPPADATARKGYQKTKRTKMAENILKCKEIS